MSTMNYLIDEANGSDHLFLFAHGAGAPMDSPFMNYIAQGLASHGIGVVRFEFPYMAKRRTTGRKSGPNTTAVLEETWRKVIEDHAPRRCWIGGKSMGGRIASHLADTSDVAGLICLGYPFHPAGNPTKTRTAHLSDLHTRTLILQGERDPLGRKDEVLGYQLSDAITLHWLPDGDHSFKPRIKSGFTEQEHWQTAIQTMAAFIKA